MTPRHSAQNDVQVARHASTEDDASELQLSTVEGGGRSPLASGGITYRHVLVIGGVRLLPQQGAGRFE
jgi:hypothetical protein